jgi:hypothetical protein
MYSMSANTQSTSDDDYIHRHVDKQVAHTVEIVVKQPKFCVRFPMKSRALYACVQDLISEDK